MGTADTLTAKPLGLWGQGIVVARDIKLSHSVFALPFALLATFLAAAHGGRLPGAMTLGLIVVCMVLARTTAMTFNRWADAALDALNPRAAVRAIPAGRLTAGFVLGVSIASAAGFVVAAAGFWWLDGNAYPLVFSPLVLAWLLGYSFTKRFTWLCHLFLGGALAISPLAAALAVEPAYLAQGAPYLLAGMVACWVAGFDLIYALQDVRADRETGVYSMPAKIGVEPALWVSRGLHVVAVVALLAVWRCSPSLGVGFAVGVAAVVLLLIVEHALVWRSSTHYINTAFLTVNGVISVLLGGLGIVDVVRGMMA